jgi:hypothetical protein
VRLEEPKTCDAESVIGNGSKGGGPQRSAGGSISDCEARDFTKDRSGLRAVTAPVVHLGHCAVHDVHPFMCTGLHTRYANHHDAGYAALVDPFAGLVLLGIIAFACVHLAQ